MKKASGIVPKELGRCILLLQLHTNDIVYRFQEVSHRDMRTAKKDAIRLLLEHEDVALVALIGVDDKGQQCLVWKMAEADAKPYWIDWLEAVGHREYVKHVERFLTKGVAVKRLKDLQWQGIPVTSSNVRIKE